MGGVGGGHEDDFDKLRILVCGDAAFKDVGEDSAATVITACVVDEDVGSLVAFAVTGGGVVKTVDDNAGEDDDDDDVVVVVADPREDTAGEGDFFHDRRFSFDDDDDDDDVDVISEDAVLDKV